MYTNDRMRKIGEALRYHRKLKGLTVSDVVVRLQDYNINVKEKTIYGWENCDSSPSADKFLALCEIYHIRSLSSILNEPQPPQSFSINPDEKNLVTYYRRHKDMQQAVRRLLEMPKPHTEHCPRASQPERGA